MNELSEDEIRQLNFRRLHRINDKRLLRRLPWHTYRKAIVLNRIGSPNIPNDIDTKELRKREGLSQPDFALIYGLSLATLRAWEMGKKKSQQALLYLRLIECTPHIVRQSLGLRA